jgi:uncharacterized protein YabE (DUF348 family)
VPRSLLTAAVQALVVTAMVVGTTAFVTFDKSVTLTLDGRTEQVRSFGRTVGDVLQARGIEVGPNDLVAPAPDQRLRDGEQVVVRLGRPVRLRLDGQTRTVWTTARNVREALMMFGVRGDGAYVSASRSRRIDRDGIALEVRLPRRLTVLADGRRAEVTTTAQTVQAALAEAGVHLRPQDRTSVGLAAYPPEEQVVAVTRVDGRRTVEQHAVAFRTVTRRTDELPRGTTRVLRQGKVGVRVRTFEDTYHDGRLADRELLNASLRQQPVTQVLLVGTGAVPQNSPSADGLNWAALARCESGGNPRAVNPAGPYYGLYQFLASTWRSVGGTGVPTQHGAAEQTYRAQLLYKRSGRGQWPVCGRLL